MYFKATSAPQKLCPSLTCVCWFQTGYTVLMGSRSTFYIVKLHFFLNFRTAEKGGLRILNDELHNFQKEHFHGFDDKKQNIY